MTKRILHAALVLALVSPVSAEEMETDRPDFTEGTQTVAPGRFQLESGYSFTYDDETDTRAESHTVPELLLRSGLNEKLELRLAWTGYEYTETHVEGSPLERADGATDLSIGVKWRFLLQDGSLPSFSTIAALGIPVGSDEVSADEVEPELKLLWAYDVNGDLGIAGNVNFADPHGEDGRYFQAAASATIGYSLSDTIGSYLEYFGFYPEGGSEERDTHYLNGGFTWGATEDIQLDIRAGLGLNDDADDFFTGVGFSCRI